jgi:hypothetical protein
VGRDEWVLNCWIVELLGPCVWWIAKLLILLEKLLDGCIVGGFVLGEITKFPDFFLLYEPATF